VRLLPPGDIEKKVEASLVRDHTGIDADFLKVPHHGSRTSSIEDFVTAVAPRVSVGEGNQIGHPVEDVLERYARAGVRLLSTDRDGEVTAITDGRTLEVHTFLESLRVEPAYLGKFQNSAALVFLGLAGGLIALLIFLDEFPRFLRSRF
jgi:beta-lactamase superfamily II metal-dependent hydrolase